MFKNFVTVFCFFVGIPHLSICQVEKDRIYSSKESPVKHSLTLYKDSTFFFTSYGDLIFKESKGRWTVKKRRLILQSFDKYRTGYIIVKDESFETKSEINTNYIFSFINQDSIPLVGATIYYSGFSYSVPESGIVRINVEQDSTFNIKYLGETYYGFFCKNGLYRKKVILVQTKKEVVFFENEKWKITRRKVVSKSGITLLIHR